ncbi:recombinase family protein [Streptomyces griseoflavus]|uniref:Integrase/recombinase n=1 Tax=Streptomyces griseoflavus Tu4000 TaxID=467200 RepID=D9Y1G7_9ACTN|nr:recombinase family protein [Streptomyces griseoflavus]EFL40051.1 integrase/recombinase [Streptomyces griseoflavus Tu4000]
MRKPTVVIYDRLSRLLAEEATDHRIAACKAYAEQRGWEVVHIATDTNVSGATKLEDRPGMREILAWLPRADYVLAAKLDRYARSVLEFQRLLKAAETTKTTIITADGAVSPENASIIVNVLAAFAEYERDMIKARITASKAHFKSLGNHLGGLAPYGYRVSGPVNNKRWVIDEPAAAIIRECADRLVNHGVSLVSMARELNERGVLSPSEHARQRDGRPLRGNKWAVPALRDVLYNPAVRGWQVQAGPGLKRGALTNEPVLDAEGNPISTGPEILSAELWTNVRAVIDSKSKGRNLPRTGKSLLLHVARCSECDGPLYRQRRIVRDQDFSTYVCRAGVGKHGIHAPVVIIARHLEDMVTGDFLKRFGTMQLMRWAEPDGSAVIQLSEVTGQIERLAGNLVHLDPNGPAARVAVNQLRALEKRQAELQAETAHAVGRWVDAGGTIADEWKRRDESGRRNLLSDLGTRAVISPAKPGSPRRFNPERVELSYAGPAWVREVSPAEAALTALELEEELTA